MAFTVTKTNTVFGDQRSVMMLVTADAATQAIQTGLSVINGISWMPISMTTTTIPKFAINSNASGVATPGTLGVSSCISGDYFSVICHGR